MRIILLQDVQNVGRKNDVKEVSPGYGRNFLFPRKLAKPATEEALKIITIQKSREEKEKSQEYQKSKSLVDKLKSLTLTFKVKIGEKGKKTVGLFAGSLLTEASKASVKRERSPGVSEGGNRAFGSVTAVKIRDALKKQGIEVEKDWILLEKPLKTVGRRTVKIKFPEGLVGEVMITVESET